MKAQLSNTTNLSDIHSDFASMLDNISVYYQIIHKQKEQHNKLCFQTFLQIS
jgi:hypothetical protein